MAPGHILRPYMLVYRYQLNLALSGYNKEFLPIALEIIFLRMALQAKTIREFTTRWLTGNKPDQ